MRPMETRRRWLDQSQPVTLVNGVVLTYIHAAFEVLTVLALLGTSLFPIFAAFVAGLVASGYGIANEKKWGWYLGIALAGIELLFTLSLGVSGLGIFSLLFIVARLALLLHTQSREYVRIWFK